MTTPGSIELAPGDLADVVLPPPGLYALVVDGGKDGYIVDHEGNATPLAGSASVFGSEYAFAKSDTVTTIASDDDDDDDAGMVRKVRLTAPVTAGRTYRIEWSYQWNCDSTSKDFGGRVVVDGDVVFDHRQETKESGGSFSTTGTDQRLSESGFDEYVPGTTKTINIDIEFRSYGEETKASIWNARLSLWRAK